MSGVNCVVRTVGLVGVLGLVACSSPPTAAHAPQAPAAEPPLALPPGVGEPSSTVLIGDLHGTREIPAFVGRLVSTLVTHQPVVLALEIPREVASPLDAFLASDGGPAARDAFTHGPWWHNEYQDGRRSVAMLELIDTARQLRAAGANLTVACIDMPATEPTGQTRDDAMAQQVMALRAAQPAAVLVVYAGDVHTRKAAMPRRPDYVTMAMRMMAAGIANGGAMVSLDASWAEGSAWVCMGASPGDCGPRFMVGKSDERGIHLERSPDGAYDGWVGVGAVTASPPAAFPELAAGLDAQLAGIASSPSARRTHARQAYNARQYARCADEYARITPPTAGDVYNQACCLALSGNKDAALERLRAALDLGYQDAAGAAADADLASLRDDPRWPFAKP
jgi:hypothetical protein